MKRLGWFASSETKTPTEPIVWLGEDGILRVDYGDSPHIDGAMIEKIRQKHIALSDKPLPVMFMATGRPSSTKDGREAASTPEICNITTAVAFVTKSWYIRQLLDLYLTFDRPPYPAFVCETEEDAADWLIRYVY